MKVIFIGASQFGLDCLRALGRLGENSVEIAGVITAPQIFPISYRPQGVVNVLYADIASYCESEGIPCVVLSKNMKDEHLLNAVTEWRPDIFLVVGWYHMLPRDWLSLAPAYGLHASLLPDYSGGAPLVWAMINGEKETGISLFKFDSGIDNGPVVGQLSTPIYQSDTIATLYDRIKKLGIELINSQVPKLVNGSAILIAQDENKRRLYPQRGPEDGLINWTNSAEKIYNFVRAQTSPYPGAFSFYGDKKLIIWACEPLPYYGKLRPGEVEVENGNELVVGCGDKTSIVVTKASFENEATTTELIDRVNITTGGSFKSFAQK